MKMNIKKYFMYSIVFSLMIAAFGIPNTAIAGPNAKCGTQIDFNFVPGTTVTAGTDVTMTEEVTTTTTGSGSQACGLGVGSYVTDGNAQIQAVTLSGQGKPCSDIGKKYCTTGTSVNADKSCTSNNDCITDPLGNGVCTTVGLTQVAHENPSDGSLDYTLDTTGLGGQVLGYQASYQGQGNFENAAIICTDVTVNQTEACTGATINIDLVYGPGAPAAGGSYEWGFVVTVHACEDLIGVTAQGGTNGWATLEGRSEDSLFPSGSTTAVIRKANKKTDVILWTIGDMTAGQTETLGVLLSGSIPPKTPDCQVRFLSGPWSALFSTDGINFEKTDYTGRVTINVDSNGNPDDCGL
jgi:hypothetical protein